MKRAVLALAVVVTAWCGQGVANAAIEPIPTTTSTTIVPTPTTIAELNLPVPKNSGSGRRIVYSNRQLRVWVTNASGDVIRTFLVSGQRGQPKKGSYFVKNQSVSSFSQELEGVKFRFMTRFAIGRNGGNIGFHEIPIRNGKPMQTVDELGAFKGSGCLRTSTQDALFIYKWANLGTKGVVVP
jgi:lipoprotein-anchoring transpeptidase ErfK/SrfK